MIAILVVSTVVIFVLVDLLLRLGKRVGPAGAPDPPDAFDPHLLRGRFVHPRHTWVKVLPSGAARIGADEFARHALPRVDDVRWPRVGTQVHRGDPLMRLESGDRHLTLAAPLTGTVTACDGRGRHGAGGPSCVLRPSRLHEELRDLRIAEVALDWLDGEKRRLADWLAGAAGPGMPATLPDGGLPVDGFLACLDERRWQDFERQFLTPPEAPR